MSKTLLAVLFLAMVGCQKQTNDSFAGTPVSIQGDPREQPCGPFLVNPQAAERGLPILNIEGANQQGAPLTIEGVVRYPNGKPVAHSNLFLYHTNAQGVYPGAGKANENAQIAAFGTLAGFIRTDSSGRYTVNTIRPAPYPGNIEPAHIHIHVKLPDGSCQFVQDIVFQGDTLLTPAYWKRTNRFGGRNYGGIEFSKNGDLSLHGHYDITVSK